MPQCELYDGVDSPKNNLGELEDMAPPKKKAKIEISDDSPPEREDCAVSIEIEPVQKCEVERNISPVSRVETPQDNDETQELTDQSKDDRAFFVLDEINQTDCDDDGQDDYETDDSLSDTEIHEMLEEGVPNKKTAEGENLLDKVEAIRTKRVLIEKNQNHFEILPDGWISIAHQSGMPVYLHRPTRVCTFSKPYFLGGGSCRSHKIPLSAIPCLEYARALEIEKEQPQSLVVNGNILPHARVETAQENDETRQLTIKDFSDYCSKLFLFRDIEVYRFSTWQSRRKFNQAARRSQRPTLPQDSKLIMCPIRNKGNLRQPKEWIMNPNGKTYVCILHDYVQRALKERPVYTFKELENTATPYLVVISINGVEYGKGIGSSKKLAKMEAAKATLEILIPDMKGKIVEHPRIAGRAGDLKRDQEDLSIFDDIQIEDPRVMEFCTKTTEPLPHAILVNCLQRNFGMSETNITYDMKPVKHSTSLFTMTVGPNTVSVQCRNKRDGKQRASQALLQKLHPHIWSWGSLLRLYGNTSIKSFKEKKVEEQEITTLQTKGVTHKPNYAIINKLREEMKKLIDIQKEVRPIGIFVPPEDVKMPTTSALPELNNL